MSGTAVLAVVPLLCPGCGDVLAAVAASVHPGRDVPIEAKDPAGDYVAVYRDGQWLARRWVPGEDVDPGLRRRGHWCVYRYACYGAAGTCPARGRLFATGVWCDAHRPGVTSTRPYR